MATYTTPLQVVVIGGGPAGTTAALRAAELGAQVTLVERGRLGGTCTNDGCAPTRVLARAARLVRDTALFESFGIPSAPGQVDLARLLRQTQQTVYQLQEKKQLIANLQRAGVRVLSEVGPARFIDPHTLRLQGGDTIVGDRFIITAGGQARQLPVSGGDLALTHHDVWTMTEVPESLAIIGAAATGCQLASIFSAFGAQVHVLELAPRILPGEDESVSSALSLAFTRRGLDVRCGVRGIERLEVCERGVRITFSDSDGVQTLEVAQVIGAIGWGGNLAGLGLAEAGVAQARGYITVDEHYRTTQDHIFAAGDIIGRVMLVQTAQADGRLAAEHAVASTGMIRPAVLIPHGGFTDPEYAGVGLTEAQARAQHGEAVLVSVVPYTRIDRAVIDQRAEGFCKLIVARDDGRLLGAHVVGEQAVEIIHVAATAMAGAMSAAQLADLALAYPTYSAVVGQAARQAVEQGTRATSPGWRELAFVASEVALP
ncbi:MAG: NAD(P)/FAD-dependent oxidoreductase [Anaerolineales bacterium]|nr:NAD(P)/FAD-dependent oxidoreductase [Anaerolineales bacterium]